MNKLTQALLKLHNPQAAWLAIESELLNNNNLSELGEIECLGGALIAITPNTLKKSELPKIVNAATAAWELFERDYKANAAIFNEHRIQLRKAIFGVLSSPKFVLSLDVKPD